MKGKIFMSLLVLGLVFCYSSIQAQTAKCSKSKTSCTQAAKASLAGIFVAQPSTSLKANCDPSNCDPKDCPPGCDPKACTLAKASSFGIQMVSNTINSKKSAAATQGKICKPGCKKAEASTAKVVLADNAEVRSEE